jgi:hypothetical protein
MRAAALCRVPVAAPFPGALLVAPVSQLRSAAGCAGRRDGHNPFCHRSSMGRRGKKGSVYAAPPVRLAWHFLSLHRFRSFALPQPLRLRGASVCGAEAPEQIDPRLGTERDSSYCD